jgi:tetratricopeptide (TPR) repeat protein
MWAWVVLGVVALASPLAEDIAFLEGQRLYNELEPAKAVFRFREALEREGRSEFERALVHAWLGLTYAQLGELDEAQASFDAAARLDAAIELPADAPPKVMEMWETARAAAAEQAVVEPAAPTEGQIEPEGPSTDAAGPSWLTLGAAATGALSVAALSGGVLFGVQALVAQEAGRAPDATQVEAATQLDAAQGSALLANAMYGTSALLAGSTAAILVVALLEE